MGGSPRARFSQWRSALRFLENIMVDVWGWIKGLFGGKGTTQIGSRNKSISAITVGNDAGGVVVGENNVVNFVQPERHRPPLEPNLPAVDVGLALANHAIKGIVHFLVITLRNTTDKTLFIGNFMLELNDEQNVFCPRDCVTGESQRKREVKSGDRFSFHIDATTLKQFGRPATDYGCAVVADAVGPPYRSEAEVVRRCVAELLMEQQ